LNDKQPAPVPSPTDREQQEIEIARTRLVDRRQPARAKVQSKHYGSRSFSSPHADHAGFRARLADALGTASPDFVDASLHQLVQAVSHCDSPEGGSEMELNAALALIESVRPTNEIEAALALQMAATHRLAMQMMGGLRRGGITANAPISGGLATKLLRAFAGQFELLDRLRRGGRQIVRVEHVTVQSGGQAIVDHVEAPTLTALIGLGPKDEIEGMIAAQLIAAHNATMECYRRAMIGEQTLEGRRDNLSQANKWASQSV
jgi:hypothetical protein